VEQSQNVRVLQAQKAPAARELSGIGGKRGLEGTRKMNRQFRAFKDRTGLDYYNLSLMFGVSIETISAWYRGKNMMQPDCRRTLERFERDGIDSYAKVRPRGAYRVRST
jgi:hypothetical protein